MPIKIAAAIITKELDNKATQLVNALLPHVDEVFIQINGKKANYVLPEGWKGKVTAQSFDWVEDFAASRNALHELMLESNNDYWLWADTGDEIENLDKLRDVVESMDDQSVDVLYCQYEYERDEHGDSVADQWRERIISTQVDGEWKGAIHETFVPSHPVHHLKSPTLVWKHEDKTEAEKEQSRQRNHKILMKLVYDGKEIREDVDPRDLYYLAMSFFGRKEFAEAVPLFLAHIKASGWEEEQYRSWKKIAEAHSLQGQYDKSISAYLSALKLFPHWKDAYLGIAECYHWMEQDEKCLEWLRTAESKQVPDTLSVIDTTAYSYKPKMMAAVSAFRLGYPDQAYRFAKEVQKVQPNYDMVKTYMPLFEKAYLETEAVKHAEWLAKYARVEGGKPSQVFAALPGQLRSDPRLMGIIQQYMEPKKWGEKSIVFLSTQATEDWGPDTLDKGMGGSEEALVYLSRELAKLGWDVTVYNDREDEYWDKVGNRLEGEERIVAWKPWTIFNPADEFNALIAWRNPNFFKGVQVKAKFKGVDMHDTLMGHQEISFPDTVDKFFFKSKWQQEYSKMPDDKSVVVGNGILKEQFE